MPELPEVETIRRQLAPLDALEVLDPRWCRPLAPAELSAAVTGRRIERLGRRGKYLVWELTDRVMRKTLHSSLSSVEDDIKSYARSNSVY